MASAGCTALALCPQHDVVAVDINPVQLEYARMRMAGMPCQRGTAERLMAFGRFFGSCVGWSRRRVLEFLDLAEVTEQMRFGLSLSERF